jgi:inner membrane protein
MEPITHLMTGACLARAGFNRKAAYATLAMTLAAELPDLDTLWGLHGPIAGFQHHRGITHTFLGVPFEGLAVVGAVWLFHRWRVRRAKSLPVPNPPQDPLADQPIPKPLTVAPIRWRLLYGFILLALLSHILLDWTNNYGVRPFFPFNPRWYEGSIVFIFEPVLFAALLIGLVAPALFGLIAGEVGAHKARFRGRAWAIFALVSMVALWGWRELEHRTAFDLASAGDFGPITQSAPPEVLRVFLSPYPVNPFRWHAVVETRDFYQLATVDALRGTVSTSPEQDIVYKPPTTLATLVAKRSWLGQVYLDWSSWPVVMDIGRVGSFGRNTLAGPAATPPGATGVTFRDLRFMYDTAFLNGRRNPPISGTVYLNQDRRVIGMEMNGKPQK